MREMKDSGIEWVGKIPKHWSVEKGKYILKYLQKPVKSDDGVITCFRDGEVTLRSNRREDGFTMSDKEIGYQGIDKGDLVVHGMDGFAGAIGISDSRGKASPVLNVLDSCCNKKYLMYYLRTMAYSDVFVALASGIRVRSCDLRWNKLASLPYPVTDIKDQSEIVQYIDKKCSEIDSISSDIQKQISVLEDYKKSVITEAVTKGINPDVEMKDSGIEYIGKIPCHWTLYRLKYILNERNSRSATGTELLLSVSQYKGVIPSSEIGNRTMQADCLVGYKQVKKDDLVFNKLNPGLARFGTSHFDGITSPDFSVYIVDKEKCSSVFLQYLFKTYRYVAKIKGDCTGVGDGFSRLYSEQLYRFVVALPTMEELESIVEYIETVVREIDSLISDKKKQLEILAEYKKSLIYEFVTGKKEVPES